MKTSLKLEELGLLLLGMYLFGLLNLSWLWFIGLFFLPDIGMLGYAINANIGALTYNLFHHKAIAIACYLIGIYFKNEILQLAGIILFSHSSFDRILGYGLKYGSSFNDIHLGTIGKSKDK